MRAVLDRLDERLREGLIKPTGRAGKGISAVLTVLAFILLMMTRTLNLIAGAQMSVRIATAVCLALPLAVMLVFALRSEKSLLGTWGLCALCAAAMLARVSFIERSRREIMNTIWRTGCKS